MRQTTLRSGYELLRGKFLWLGIKLCCKAILPYYYRISGFLSEAEALTLYRLARKLPASSTIVEIGSWQGRSTYCLARGLRSGTVHAIDPFDASGGGDHGAEEVYRRIVAEQDLDLRQTFLDNMRRAGVAPKIQIAHGVARDFVGAFPTIDLLFIDGDHSVEGCLFDFEQFGPCLRPGGYLLFHDYHPERPELGVTWVIDRHVTPSGCYKHLALVDSLWVGQRLSEQCTSL